MHYGKTSILRTNGTTTSASFTGIGLASVKAIVTTVYGGDIFVSNHPDGGAYTLIAFPIQENASLVTSHLGV